MNTEQLVNLPELENLAKLISFEKEKFSHQILLERETQKILLFAFAEGQELKTHTTPQPALLIMLEGTCLFSIHNSTQTLSVGEVISIPARVPHALSATRDFKMILIK